jgi:hypothetical protein
MDLHHWYHIYADGDWVIPVHEHIRALQVGGLYDQLASFQIGFVGSDDNIANVCNSLEVHGVEWTTVAAVTAGFEQETLDKMWEFSQDHDGFGLYTHTKGASRVDPIDNPWRQSMEQLCVVEWRTAIGALDCDSKAIVGCHWIKGDPTVERLNEAWLNRELNPPGLDGVGGMFGGNFWWTRLDLLRQNCRPGRESRFAAEHWLGQLSEVMPINADTILDLNPRPIVPANLVPLRLT